MSNAIVVIDPERALVDATNRRQIVNNLRAQNILRPGIDFGVIPGSDKPTLLKPGAERLCAAFGLNPQFELINAVERWDPDNPLFHYQYRCRLIHIETGLEFATGIGSCNSMEAQHRWRNAERTCPECGKTAIIKGKPEYGGGWLCFKKMGGCGAKFAIDDPAITEQVVGKIPNDDVFSLVNTIDKKAQKRSLIAAVLIGANASEHFTQDVEELPGFGGGNVIDSEYTVIDTHTGEIKPPPATVSSDAPKAYKIEHDANSPTVRFGEDKARIEAFCKRMSDAYGVTALEIVKALGVARFGEYAGSEGDAEAAVKAWVKPEAAAPAAQPVEPKSKAKPSGTPNGKAADAKAPDWTPELAQAWSNMLKWAADEFDYDEDGVLLLLNDVMPPVLSKKDWRGTTAQARGAVLAGFCEYDAARIDAWCDKAGATDELRGRAKDMAEAYKLAAVEVR